MIAYKIRSRINGNITTDCATLLVGNQHAAFPCSHLNPVSNGIVFTFFSNGLSVAGGS